MQPLQLVHAPHHQIRELQPVIHRKVEVLLLHVPALLLPGKHGIGRELHVAQVPV